MNDVTITLTRAEAILLNRTLGAAIQRFEFSEADDETLCDIQDNIADRLITKPVRTVGIEQPDGSVVQFEV